MWSIGNGSEEKHAGEECGGLEGKPGKTAGIEFLSSRLGTPDAAGRCLFSRLPPTAILYLGYYANITTKYIVIR